MPQEVKTRAKSLLQDLPKGWIHALVNNAKEIIQTENLKSSLQVLNKNTLVPFRKA